MNSKRLSIKQRALKSILTFVLACSFVILIGGVSGFGKAKAGEVTINTAEEFIAYSQNYTEENKNDTITISINSGDVVTTDGFISLGTSASDAFEGTLVLPASGVDVFHLFDCPLFNYVSTDMTIIGASTLKIMREEASTSSNGALKSGSLFANHVKKGTNSADWNITLFPLEGEGTEAESFEGLIGDIEADATVRITFTDTSSLNASGNGNIGYICNTLGAGATLEVTTAGSGSHTVSGSGNVGGLVGEMGDGAKLVLKSANNTGITSVSSSGGYAGGIVGKVNDVTSATNGVLRAEGITDYAVSCTVTGETGAGGLFGYYKNSIADETFTLENTYAISNEMTISSTGSNSSAGGVFGVLENCAASFTFDGNASGYETFNVNISGGSNRGGLCGTYTTNDLKNTFTIEDTSLTVNASGNNSGGLIGRVSDNPSYILIPGTTVTSRSGTLGGGLIGYTGDGGTFVDITGDVTISGKCQAALIRNMPRGVLRIQGTTDISQTTVSDAQIVRNRGSALIYALGTGSDSGWTLKRNLSNAVDDVLDWGEVLRVNGTTLSEGDLFGVNMTDHTVTVKAAVTTMNNITEFAKTALNIQLGTEAGKGALQFASENQSATLLGGILALNDDISLAGTGLTGLTRDNGQNVAFTGTFNGNNHSITFATGENYGWQSDGSNQGNIFKHEYNGLFAKTGNGATFNGLTLLGSFKINQKLASDFSNGKNTQMRLGGLTAYATGTLAIDGVTAGFTLDFRTNGDYQFCFGGAVGEAFGENINISVKNSNFRPIVYDKTGEDNCPNVSGNTNPSLMGGVIGYVSPAASQSISIKDSAIGLNYAKTTNTARTSHFGSAIAKIGNNAYVKDSRTVSLENVTVNIDATGTAASSKFGGILGTDWLSADVSITGLTVLHAGIKANASANFGGLVYTATGHWSVNSITLTANEVKFNYPISSTSTFGFIANKTAVSDNALYLEVNDANYNISALKFVNDGGTEQTSGLFKANSYDEIVATGIATGSDIVANGQSIISITTSDDVINTAGSYNTYLNKTAYGKNESGKINPNTRYYYNIAYARENTATPKYNFLTWTVGQYAHPSLSSWFTASSTFTGDLDMTGLSYYPIDLTTGVTFSNATLKLDNDLMEANVKYAYSGETGTRSTRSNTNQHYLMHTAAFRNVTSGISINGLTIQGNVPKISDSFCGFLVAGKFGGNETGDPTALTASDIMFDGAYITTDTGENITTSIYAPLFINKIGKNTNILITGAKQANDGDDSKNTGPYHDYGSLSKYAASSLIGDVGSETAQTITLTFLDIRFDGRSTSGSIGNLDNIYDSTRSIFSRATILNSFKYAGVGDGSGTYNFSIDEDWDSTTGIHHVTYGKEITDSDENSNKQQKYYSSDYYTHPTTNNAVDAYDFSSGFLPYVYVAYNLSEYKHELSVNVQYNSDITGFGKYDKPYVIDGTKLEIIAKIINGIDVGTSVKINLPGDLMNFDYTTTGYAEGKYTFGTSDFTKVSGDSADTQTTANVRRYLAGAYYLINDDITLASDFIGLGNTTLSNPEYAFRGVIIGNKKGDVYPTITNKSTNPLVITSHGCVIKDVTVDISVDYNDSNVISLAAPAGNATYDYSGGIRTYGALIGQILGGDTIIDNANVTFSDVSFVFTGVDGTHFERLTPIGGYVGTLVNGGLIFRNMTSSNVGLSSTVCDKIDDAGYLYVNPIIGRVIAGFAFHETTTYAVTSASIPNGTKNYTISDLSLSAGKLNITNENDQFTIEIPDGQAMYVLGAIVNSGAASASYDASTEQAYNALSGFWQAYHEHTTTRADATYDYVGQTSVDGYDADLAKAGNDQYTDNRVKIPYIISTYTNKAGNVYLARSVSSRANNIVSVTGDCDVAAGFRGIGSIYLDNDLVRLRISKMNGNSHNITLNMDYREYDHKSVSSYIATANTAGLGLFNITTMKSPSETNSVNNFALDGSIFYDVYVASTGAQSQYLYGAYVNDRFETESPRSDNVNNINKLTYLSVGGVFGYSTTPYYIKNVTFSDFSVEGAKTAGGLIGYSRQKDNTISYIKYDSDVDNNGYVNVVGGLQAGGLIGRIFDTKTEIIGDSSGFTDLIIKNIEMKSQTPNEIGLTYFANKITGVGGIVGSVWNSRGGNGTPGNENDDKYSISPQTRRLFITNINITKGNNAANISVRNNSPSDMQFNSAGGFIGLCHSILVHIYDCKLTDVNVSANTAGGLIGRVTQHFYIHVHNVTIDCNNKNSSITGTRFAGGAIGWMTARDNWYFEFDGVVVNNYNVISSSTSNNICAAGGVIGFAEGDSKAVTVAENRVCELDNITVSGCLIKTNYSDESGKVHNLSNNTSGITAGDHCGTGGIIGAVTLGVVYEEHHEFGNSYNKTNNGNNKFRLSGYNILVDSTTLTHLSGGLSDQSTFADNRKIGEIIGNNAASSAIRFVGVSEKFTNEITFCGKHVGYYYNDDENFGSDTSDFGTGGGYIVFADYNAVQTNQAFTEIDPLNNHTNVEFKAPWVTINPSFDQNGVKITGDGIAASVDDLPIKAIISDGATGRYKYSASANYSAGVTNLAAFSSYIGKLQMFGSEVTEFTGTDFPVLILDTTEKDDSHKLINSYLRLLTNTTFDFGTDVAKKFEVKIYNMIYSPGSFLTSATDASLQRKGGQFYMLSSIFDSAKEFPQFSLIDVRFFDPANESRVAYHLYVPVFVKKVLSYQFDIAILSGTTYLESEYTPKYGLALIENVGTPVTAFFKYTYSRTATEWQSAINAGENVSRNYLKSLKFDKQTGGQDLSDDTILVLVDRNDGGRPYYSKWGDAKLVIGSSTTINLSAFKSIMTVSNGVVSFSGDSFEPKKFEEMMTIEISNSNDGTLVACNENDPDPVVNIGGQGYRLATDDELADESVSKFSANVSALNGDTNITESYFLSMFTDYADVFHYYTVTAPSAFAETDYPSKMRTDVGKPMSHLVNGNIFYHGNFAISSLSKEGSTVHDVHLMTASNNALQITMSAQIGLSNYIHDQGTDFEFSIANLINSSQVYQSFLVFLTRKEGNDIKKAIIGNPIGSGVYSADKTLDGESDVDQELYSTVRVTPNSAEFVTGNLNGYFSPDNSDNQYKFEINAVMTLQYPSEAVILSQFPGQNDLFPDNGVTVSGSSNIGFSATETTNSKNSIGAAELPTKIYYSEAEPEVATLDLNPKGDKVGDFTPLGINAKNNNGATRVTFRLLAELNTTPIASQITDYADAVAIIKLAQKNDFGVYEDIDDISAYISALIIGNESATDNGDSYSAVINKASLTDNGASITFPELNFTILTGSAFESAGLTYGNFKITMSVVLRSDSGIQYPTSRAQNYVIYTNAKVFPEYITN